MDMERKDDNGGNGRPCLSGEIFAVTKSGNGHNGSDSAAQAQAVRELHARLASPEFVDQMTGVFYEAKRAALASSR